MWTMISRADRQFSARWATRAIAAAFTMALGTSLAYAGDLDASQQALLQEAKTHLNQLTANLKLAQESAGPGDSQPTGSKAKLAMMRLESAKQSIPQVAARLEKLPADNADVQAVQQQFDAVKAESDQLEMRLTGKTATENAQADSGVKLDYKQEEDLKNARFYLREIQGKSAALAQLVEKLRPVEDQNRIDHREVQAAASTFSVATERIKLTREYLDKLPSDGQGVQAVAHDLEKAVTSLNASVEFLRPIHQKLTDLINPANYPDLQTDTERLSDLSRMYSDAQVFELDRPRAADVIREAPAAVAERDRLVKKYALLIHQQTPEGKRIEGISNHFTLKYLEFAAIADQQKQSLPGQIKADMDEARDIAKEAVEQQKPAFFTGGIPQHLGWIDDKLALYDALDPAGAKPLHDELAQLRAELKKGEAALREQIIASNNLPDDNYAGSDRDAIAELATAALKKLHPDAEILATRIPSKEWKHEILWRHQNDSWYKIDRSRVQAQLIVKHDDKCAAIQPVDLWKDHLSNDEVKAFPLFDKDWELQPSDLLLLEKVK